MTAKDNCQRSSVSVVSSDQKHTDKIINERVSVEIIWPHQEPLEKIRLIKHLKMCPIIPVKVQR